MSDVVSAAVIRESFASIVREMRRAVARSSYSSIIYEGYDFSCVLVRPAWSSSSHGPHAAFRHSIATALTNSQNTMRETK